MCAKKNGCRVFPIANPENISQERPSVRFIHPFQLNQSVLIMIYHLIIVILSFNVIVNRLVYHFLKK